MRKINFNEWAEKIPDYTLEALQRYFEYGLPPGSFLTAVLQNDLMGALAKADEYNKEALQDICSLVYWEFPEQAYGSEYKVLAYMSQKLAERQKQFAEENDHE
jgi:hypothetical protein